MKKLHEVYSDLADNDDYVRGFKSGAVVGGLIGTVGSVVSIWVLLGRALRGYHASPDDRQLSPARGVYGPRAW